MNTKCLVLFLCSVIVSAPAAEPTRDELIKSLVQKGDQVAKTDARAAFWAYLNARLYAPEDKEINERLNVTKPELGRIEKQDDINRTASAARFIPSAVYTAWPKVSPQLDQLELRMLNDPRITGEDWRCKRIDGSNGTLYMFLKKPDIGFQVLRDTFGAPASEKSYASETTDRAWTVWTYSRWRIIGKGDEIHYIVWAAPANDPVLR